MKHLGKTAPAKSEITSWVVQLAETKGDITVEFRTFLSPSDYGRDDFAVFDNGVEVKGGGDFAGDWAGPFPPASERSALQLLGTLLLGIAGVARRKLLTRRSEASELESIGRQRS